MQGDQHRQHISGQFNDELDSVKNHLLEMGGLVEQQLMIATQALLDRDSGAASRVIDGDAEINALELQIDRECSRILARRQPAASDLRLVLAVAKSTTDLERIGDEASRIARQAVKLSESSQAVGSAVELRQIGRYVASMLRDSLDSFARLDTARALAVVADDGRVDDQHDAAMQSLELQMQDEPRNIKALLNEMWALRCLERVGDHATNIAEQVVYLVRGIDVRHMNAEELTRIIEGERS